MIIRESVEDDKSSIKSLHQDAFGQAEGKAVSRLAIDLLEDMATLPIISLVAEQENEIIGNIVLSSVDIEGAEGVSAYILAPLAITASHQGKGIGTKLISRGLEILKARGAKVVLVYGDPNYYKRVGFKAGHNLKPPFKLRYSDEAWMALELEEGILAITQGMVKCAASLTSPDYW